MVPTSQESAVRIRSSCATVQRQKHNSPGAAQLASLTAHHTVSPVAPGVRALEDALRSRYGEAIEAILVYGSCFRRHTDEGLVDLYVIVDNYRCLDAESAPRWLYRILPPTVFYLQVPLGERLVRAKYAVLSLADFQRGTSPRWVHSYLWARFAQRTGVLYVRNEHSALQVHTALADAVVTFVGRVLPVLPPTFAARDLWRQGLRLTYGTELRPEPSDAVAGLFDEAPGYYEHATRMALECMPFEVRRIEDGDSVSYEAMIPWRTRFASRLAWIIRKVLGKTLNVLRLLKGLFTFQGGMDYIIWKIERHSGIRLEMPARLEQYPWLARVVMLWKLYRRGTTR